MAGIWLTGLAVAVALMVATWLVSLRRNDVSIVDMLWGPAIAAAGMAWLWAAPGSSPRGVLAVSLAALWALRLALFIFARNHGKPEDRRYREIRARNEPGFRWKALYLVFGLQALLACMVGLPLYGAALSPTPLGWLDLLGGAFFAIGFTIEAMADWQMARFQRTPAAGRGVMDQGWWRYSRHPNYFGEACLWWGLWLVALGGGAWWTAVGPALLTVLLLKVSGVALTEKDIASRRPDYQAYIRRTSAFFPLPPRG